MIDMFNSADPSLNGPAGYVSLGAMKVMLISQRGTIQTIWLPDIVEGRYRFQNVQELPLYIEAKNDRWVAHVEKSAVFHTENGPDEREQILSDELLSKILYHNREYVLYAETNRLENSEFLPYYLEERSDYLIGRKPESHIYYPNKTVSWKHAILHWDQDGWMIIDQNSTNGTYVNGHRVESARLVNGDVVYIMGLYILVGSGFVGINNSNHRIVINTPRIHHILSKNDVVFPRGPAVRPVNRLFDRPPRRKIGISPETISIDVPPMPLTGSRIPLLLRMGSPMVMGGRALMTGNVVMTLTSLVFPALTQGLTEKDRKEYEAKRTVIYREYLAEKEQEIHREKMEEERMLNECYPSLSHVLHFAATKERLWERRQVDEDFLNIRVGTGRIPMIAEREFAKKSFEVERDVLKEEMYDLAERPVFLENVPIMVSFRKNFIVGVLGLTQDTVTLLKNIVMQLVLTHSYDEVKLVLLADEQYAETFHFVRYLPHNWDNDRSIRFFAVNPSDAQLVSEYLGKEIESLLDKEQKKGKRRNAVSYVVLALSKELFDCVESLKEVLSQEEYCGVSIIAAFQGVPKECSEIIDLREKPKLIYLSSAEKEDQPFQEEHSDQEEMQSAMRELMCTKLMVGSEAYTLPGTLTFLEMFGAGRVEHLNPLRRWTENNPVKSLAVPIGVGTDGRLFTLDLHEKRQGPHGLVAGMTGSGKSEFLITYILSMAVNFSPDEVAFILIDYKGGGLADAFENKDRGIHLPHLVGTITNLDGASIDRSLMSIKSELTRRQTVFKEVKMRIGEGTLDIYDYQKLYRNQKVEEPMPHLFIISDEFAELKQQQPMFMDELISAARIGRSLGVHLILATQKPGGVVNNQIWSNTKFRACLRVQDRSDSMEMLKRPEAAELKHTGRFYLQVGYNEYFALGQSAWCGADYIPQDEVIEEQDNAVEFIDNAGKAILSVKPETEKKQAESRQVVSIVNYLSDLAKREGIQARSLWTDPLSDKIELSSLMENIGRPDDGGITALLGTIDDPEFQCQFPMYLNLLDFHNLLLVGNAGSGKSTFLRTMLYSLVTWYSPERLNYYILDFSDHALSGYRSLPHCGAYLTDKQTSDLGRLMDLIHGIIARRKELFAQAEVTSYESYCQLHPLPLILFIVDGFTKIKGLEGGESFFIKFPDYLREGSSFGIRFVVTCNHINEVGIQSRQELDGRIALQAKDHYEYSDILGVRCKNAPPEINGRGMCLHEGRPLAYQTAMLDCGENEANGASLLRDRLKKIIERDRDAAPAERLPMVDFEQTYEEFCQNFRPGRIPLGYAARDMKPVSIPFQQLHSMSLYFGNPKGVRPVLSNLLTAAQKNGMQTILIRRAGESVWEEAPDGHLTCLESTKEGLAALADLIMSKIQARNVLRDEYCAQQGIPLSSKGKPKKAAKYIRENTAPVFVCMERFEDICRAETEFRETEKSEELQGKLIVFFSMMRWYNIYFAAGFYPEDDYVSNHPLLPHYNKDELILLFGGRYDKISIKNIPYQITKHDQVDQDFRQFLMKYQNVFHPLIMPCGKLEEENGDPDDAPII